MAIKTSSPWCQIIYTPYPSDKKEIFKNLFLVYSFSLVPLDRTILNQAMKDRIVFETTTEEILFSRKRRDIILKKRVFEKGES